MAKVHKVYEPEFREMVVRLVLEVDRTIRIQFGRRNRSQQDKTVRRRMLIRSRKQALKELYEENRLLRQQLAE